MLLLSPQEETAVSSDHLMLQFAIFAWGCRLGGEQLLLGPPHLTGHCHHSSTSLVSDLAVTSITSTPSYLGLCLQALWVEYIIERAKILL